MWRSSARNMWLHAAGGGSKSFCRLRWNCNFTLALMRPGPWGFRKDICCGNCSLSFSFRNKSQTLIGDYIGHKSTNLWNGRHGDCLQVLQCLSDPCRSNQLQSCCQSFRTCGHFECEFARNAPKRIWNLWFSIEPFCEINEKERSAFLLFNVTPVNMFYQCDTTAAESFQPQCSAVFLFSNLFHRHLLPTHVNWGMKFSPCRFKPSLEKANLPHSLYIFITISISPWRVHPKFLAWLSRIHAKCSNVILGNHLS